MEQINEIWMQLISIADKLDGAAQAIAALILAAMSLSSYIVGALAKAKLIKAAQVKKFNAKIAQGMNAAEAIQHVGLSVKEAVAHPKIGFNKLEDFVLHKKDGAK